MASELYSIGFRWRGAIGIAVLVPLGLLALLSPLPSERPWLLVLAATMAWPLFIAGVVLRFWSTLYIGGRKHEILVCEGPYSICRNPLYLGTILLTASAGLFLESLLFTFGVVIIAIVYALATVPVEERYLSQYLGAPYRDYCARVPRFWPRPSLFATSSHLEVDLEELGRECRSAIGYLLIPLLALILNALRAQPWWPHLVLP